MINITINKKILVVDNDIATIIVLKSILEIDEKVKLACIIL